MANGKYVAYFRVSTQKQGDSGLGLEAQQEAVNNYLNGGKWKLVGQFTEVESGTDNDRPALDKALAACRLYRATLVIAKLDRLSRDTEFLLHIVNGSSEGGVVFCDLPTVPEGPLGKFFTTQMAAVAELEAGLISMRTKAALAAAKARGTVLGRPNSDIAKYAAKGLKASLLVRRERAAINAADVIPIIEMIREEGTIALRGIAASLNERHIPAPRGGEWSAAQVMRVLRASNIQ